MRKTTFTYSALAAALALSLSTGAAIAATDTVSTAFESQGTLHFQPSFVATGYALKISGPGNFDREMLFTDEDMLGVSIKSLGQLVDGSYNYEITPIKGFGKRQDDRSAGVTAERSASELSSGTFTVAEGKVVFPDTKTPEAAFAADDRDVPSVTKDQVILDDLIVDGSICAGMDCVNGESFGFDTLRLKENNLRIKFDDTSASASFPNVDWQLTANDSANGGANKFSIDDITNGKTPFTVEANAPSHSLFVDDGGRIGLGTSTPSVEMHIIDGDTPTVRLQQDGSSGFAAQSWDMAGNETNFFIRDVTNGSRLPFRIRPGAPTSSIDIAANGNVGIGTQSPSNRLDVHVNDSGFPYAARLVNDNAASTFVAFRMETSAMGIDFNNTNSEWRLNFDDGDNQELTLDADGNLTIDGTLTANGSSFPDFVFHPEYKLLSLSDVEQFIVENGHLPNVPSAEHVAANGLDVVAMQKKLFEKVEELTLYTLQQQKLIDQLQSRLDSYESKSKSN